MDSQKYDKTVWKVINKFARGRSREDKQDLYQEVHMSLLQSAEKIRLADKPEALVYKIAQNRVVDFARSAEPTSERLSDNHNVATESTAVEDIRKKELVAAINKLPEPERVLLLLFFYEDLPEEEVAHRMNKSRRQVRDAKQLALVKLRNLLGAPAQPVIPKGWRK